MNVREWLDQSGMRRAFESIGVGVAVHDPTGALVHLNPAGLELLGWTSFSELSLEEFLARFSIQLPTGQPATLADLPVSQALAGREGVDTEMSIRLASGLRRQLRVICRRVHDERGRLEAVVETFLDYGEAASARGAVRGLVEQSTPVLSVGNKLLLQPLIGTLDSQRAAQAMEKLLETIGNTGARVAIADITGVSAVDTATANHLLRSLAAAIEFGRRWVEAHEILPVAEAVTRGGDAAEPPPGDKPGSAGT
jgi:hypothetical protein